MSKSFYFKLRILRQLAVAMLALAAFAWAPSVTARVVISEFMAQNDETFADGDGNYSDWIELYNSGATAVELTGWHVTDDISDLTKWTFSSASIGAGEYLVVFASGQEVADYIDPLGYAHTTFKLSGDGESVALVRPDGVSVEHAYENYPEQSDDVSYGYGHDVAYHSFIVEEQDATAIEGSFEPAITWTDSGFDDSTWLSGQTGVGYERGRASDLSYGSMINLSLPDDMFNRTHSAYIRVPFTSSVTNELSQLVLRMKYDDGFVAYLNGVAIASANAPASAVYTSSATAENSGSAYEDFTVLDAQGLIQEGDNILAIHSLAYPTVGGRGVVQDQFISPAMTGLEIGEMLTNATLYLEAPTPGGANVAGVLGYVGDTSFSVDRGFYTNAFEVEITCKTSDAIIRYTLDGTTPTFSNGTLYTNAITISRTSVLRAAGFKTGYQPSDTDTQTYIFLEDVVSQPADPSGAIPYFPTAAVNGQVFDYEMDPEIVGDPVYSSQIRSALMDVRTISLVTDPDNLFSESTGIYSNPQQDGYLWERPASVELLNPDGSEGFQINGGVRIRGGSSRATSNPKHSFRLFFRSEYGTSRLAYDLFGDEGAESFKRIDFRTGQNFSWQHGNSGEYSTWLYDIFVRDVHRSMGQPYTRGWYFHLYVNGMYWGLFQTEERPEARYAESYYGGDDDDFDVIKSGDNQGVIEATNGELDAYQELWSGVDAGVETDEAYFRLQGLNPDGTRNAAYTRLLDVDNVIDYMLSVFYVGNRDSPLGPPNSGQQPRNLFALYNRANPDGYKFIGHDSEHALGYHLNLGVNYDFVTERSASVAASASLGTMENFNPWWLHLQLVNNDEYKLRFADRVNRHLFNNGILTPENATAVLLARAAEMEMAIIAESARWGDYKVSPARTKDSDWLVAVNRAIDEYLQASPSPRRDIVFSQIETMGWLPSTPAPVFSQHGGTIGGNFELDISGNGQIYYTLDGSDPRAIGGAVAGAAYVGALLLDHSAVVKARVLDNGEWSALTEAVFVLDATSPLRVTEIMYHPADPTDGIETNFTASDFEFIELLNTGSETVGLAGVEFTEGVQFDFTEGAAATLAPGEYAVLVSNFDAFTNRYANWATIPIAGEFHGKFFIADAALDNAGEDIVLQDGLGNTILNFKYEDWYALTDGEGFSLTLIDPTASTNTWSESSAWRASKYVGGTPGAGPEDFLAPNNLVINEALTHQDADNPGDWVELYNASTQTIDINGWFISDDEDDAAKVELSGLSAIAPGGYLRLTEYAHFGLAVAGTNGFALSELGDEIVLTSAESGTLTGYRVSESFGAIARDDTFGRHVLSTGESDFAIQSVPSPDAVNGYPLVGPVVISEIMYHPAGSNAFEYMEIVNTGSTAVPLYHVTYPTNTWRLEGAVEFIFPEGTILSAGECIVIAETNSAAFTAFYGVPVFGVYEGQLANEGEDLYLTKPGDPEALTGEVPYIVVEHVGYNDASPWPSAADGLGASLERSASSTYPNDPASWNANWSLSPGTADFSDEDDDGLPDDWELDYFGSTNALNGGADDDWDMDGATNGDEWAAGTNPTNPASVFMIQAFDTASGRVLTWSSETGKLYALWVSTNLVSGAYGLVADDIAATPPENTYDAGTNSAACSFYRLTVEDE